MKKPHKSVHVDMVYASITTLSAAFIWKESVEGHDYWAGICKRLEEIAATEEAKRATKH